MKKYSFLLFLPILFTVTVFTLSAYNKAPELSKATAPAGITFIENDWTAAVKKASAEKKYIFVDCYATWCGPCKMLKLQTFRNQKVADFFNDKFVNVSIDMEKGQGPVLAQKWQIQAYPTLIVFDQDGKPVSGTMGFMNPTDLLAFAQQALTKKN